LAAHPDTGELYAILRLSGGGYVSGGPRALAIIDVETGVATEVGNTGDKFSAIAFDLAGQLFGVTGTGGLVPDTLYRISTDDGSTTSVTPLTSGGGGEALAFHSWDGLLYRAGGGDWAGPGVFQKLALQDLDDPADHFSFELTEGQAATLVVSGDQPAGVELLAGDGTPLAIGLVDPVINGAAIRDFVALSGGTYVARVTANQATDYRLLVTRGIGFEQEPNDTFDQARPLGVTAGVLGHVGAFDDLVVATVSTPFTFYDGAGYKWDISGDGSIGDGTSDAFDGGFWNADFGWFDAGDLEADGRELVLGPLDGGGIIPSGTGEEDDGLQITRKVYVSPAEGFARVLDIYTNTGFEPLTRTVNLYTNLGSDGQETVVGTSSGDDMVAEDDNWVVTEDNRGQDPTVGHVIAGPGRLLGPAAFSRSGDNIDWAFDLTLQPGETQIVMSFGVQDWDTAAVLDRVAMLEQTPESALIGMTGDELAAVVNFSLSLADWYSLEVAEPTTLTITTTTPGDGTGEFSNTLDPMIALYAPDGTWLADDDNSAADGRNAELVYSVTEPGTIVSWCSRSPAWDRTRCKCPRPIRAIWRSSPWWLSTRICRWGRSC
jgi:hypothetical protein